MRAGFTFHSTHHACTPPATPLFSFLKHSFVVGRCLGGGRCCKVKRVLCDGFIAPDKLNESLDAVFVAGHLRSKGMPTCRRTGGGRFFFFVVRYSAAAPAVKRRGRGVAAGSAPFDSPGGVSIYSYAYCGGIFCDFRRLLPKYREE
ncbi:unnamed protein product [Ectocarpus fasciculatus]